MSEALNIKLNRLAKEYMERFGRQVPISFGGTDELTVEALEEALEKDRPIPDDYDWFTTCCRCLGYILRHNTQTDRWQLTLFESRHKPPEL